MKIFICIFFVFLTIALSAQSLTRDQLTADFDRLRSGLEEAHGGLYRHHSEAAIHRLFVKYRKKLRKPLSHLEFYGFLSRFLAEIGDGHMRLDFDEKMIASQPKPLLFPFQVLTDKDRIVILTNDTRQDSLIKPGMTLISINGHKMQKLKSRILPFLISDGKNQTKKLASFERNFSQYFRVLVDTSSTFITEVKDTNGQKYTVTIRGVVNTEREINRNQNAVNASVLQKLKSVEGDPGNLSLRFINGSTAYLRVRYFVGPKFNREIDSLFELINKHQLQSLILDLRGNGGGLDQWGAHLASKFATKPFRYIEQSRTRVLVPSFADWKDKPPVDLINGTETVLSGGYRIKPVLNSALAIQQPAHYPFTGKIVVLINGRTFSAASDFSAILSNLTDAVFVGEETGGGYQGNTSALNAILVLPHSKFKVNIHLWDLWSAVKPPSIKSRGLMPDYPVDRKIEDWMRGIDTQLEFAIDKCR